jgi:hypothetical protein
MPAENPDDFKGDKDDPGSADPVTKALQAIERLADLGLLAAAAKGETIPDELKAFLDGGR